MSQNIFDASLDHNNQININTFDWSHANNLTTQIGRITPVFCDLLPAKSTFRVNPRFGLQFMPLVFPIQTRLKARIAFFRMPLRALWKDYTDFVGNFRQGLVEPYLNFNSTNKLRAMAATGSLGDYLGLPSTDNGKFSYNASYALVDSRDGQGFKPYGFPALYTTNFNYDALLNTLQRDKTDILSNLAVPQSQNQNCGFPVTLPKPIQKVNNQCYIYFNNMSSESLQILKDNAYLAIYKDGEFVGLQKPFTTSQQLGFTSYHYFDKAYLLLNPNCSLIKLDSETNPNHPKVLSCTIPFHECSYTGSLPSVRELTLETCPWYSNTQDTASTAKERIKVSAYAFRAYEAIYNAYFRDSRNNPYYVDGQVQYNRWIPTDEGGLDDNTYELRYANWEKDFLTTAVQSPQQGAAPLVGLTTYTQTVTNADGSTTELVKTALVDEQGKKYGISYKQSPEGLEGVEYVELADGTSVRQARNLYDVATSGISISDLRMVNCYQKFLELNMRKGYSYKDIVEGRFDVKVRYSDLMMPEFFGGVSRDVDVNAVTQTVDNNTSSASPTYDKALGSQSGLAGCRGESNANIECFCDEESIVIGVLVVTPLPVYTQLLPKHFTYRNLLDHYQPEFNNIGFQPITYKEVCPIQAFNDNPKSLNETFGYNRPWYEYVQKYDTAHGLFRTQLSNFLMHRTFSSKPSLSRSFLEIDPSQVTDVFSVTETTDKIYGQIWLDITCKLPIARVAIPRLD